MNLNALQGTDIGLGGAHRLLVDAAYRNEVVPDMLEGGKHILRSKNAYKNNIRDFVHYDLRQALNVNLPATLDEMREAVLRGEWEEMSVAQSAFHQNADGVYDPKFIHPDGREAVYDGGSERQTLLLEEEFMGTFNYVNGTISSHPNPGIKEMKANISTQGSKAHKVLDVDPWVVLENTRGTNRGHLGYEARQRALAGAVLKPIPGTVVNSIENTASAAGNNIN